MEHSRERRSNHHRQRGHARPLPALDMPAV
jgi:hypothetical protein